MPDRECSLCHDPAEKQCACKKAWYCGKDCQSADWVQHIFVCKPSKVTTAHYLALAVNRNLMPEHPQTIVDYGFSRTTERGMLLGLYIGLIKHLNVKTQTLHKWRTGGTLVDNIKTEFEKLPETSRGRYYQWFLQNQDVVSGVKADTRQAEAEADDMLRRAWIFIRRSPTPTEGDLKRYLESAPDDERDCFFLYGLLLTGAHPNPEFPHWISFGFCAAYSQEAEMDLARSYITLINRCTFSQFVKAYISGSLISLFENKGIHITDPLMNNVLSGSPHSNSSVWDLKQFVERKHIHGPEDTTILPVPSVIVDYGFFNCKTPEERKLLLDLYIGFFALGRRANPLQLHQACIKGRLFAYFAEDLGFKVKPKKVYERLLKNPYPLPDL